MKKYFFKRQEGVRGNLWFPLLILSILNRGSILIMHPSTYPSFSHFVRDNQQSVLDSIGSFFLINIYIDLI
jgi:hypothetical protein